MRGFVKVTACILIFCAFNIPFRSYTQSANSIEAPAMPQAGGESAQAVPPWLREQVDDLKPILREAAPAFYGAYIDVPSFEREVVPALGACATDLKVSPLATEGALNILTCATNKSDAARAFTAAAFSEISRKLLQSDDDFICATSDCKKCSSDVCSVCRACKK